MGIIVLLLPMFIGCGDDSKYKNKEIKIGAILPLTGDLSSYGVDTKKALELAVMEINSNDLLNDKKVKIIIEDSQGSPRLATNAFNKLIEHDKVIGVLGPITSPEVLAIAPIANSKQIPIISPSSTNVDITNAGDYVFRTINADNIETIAFAKFVKDKYRCIDIGIIANRASGTLSYATSFENNYMDDNCEVVQKEIYQEGTKDFKEYILKLLNRNVNGIYISGVSMEIGTIVRQIREFDKDIILFSYQSAEDKRVIEIAGEAVDNMYYSTTTLPEIYLGDKRKDFNKAFHKQYGYEPGIFSAEIYDGINVLYNAFYNSEKKGDPVIKHLKGTKGYEGASGNITFDENGDVHKAIAIYKYDSMQRKPLYIVDNNEVISYESVQDK